MKDYRQLIKELPSSTVVCALGEFNPPTTAHELLVKTVKVVAEQRKAAHAIYTSPSNLISEERKEQFLKLMFPKTKFQSLGETFFATTVKQLTEKYRKVVIVAGADQFAEFKKLKESANVEIISIGTKDPDADNAKMKQYVTKGLYEDFKKLLPSTIRDIDGKRLMNEMRTGMQLEPIKEQINLVKDKLREDYFKGKIFNVGDIVEADNKQYEIVKRGSNHLLLKEETGELVSKWIHDVKVSKLKEAVIQPNGTDKIDPNAPESDTGAKQSAKPAGKTKGFLTFYNYKLDKQDDQNNSRSGNQNAVGGENTRTVREDIDIPKDAPSVEAIAKKHNVSVEEIQKALEAGMKVEAEHGKNPGSEREIALDHLNERPDYYTRLKKFVESLNEEKPDREKQLKRFRQRAVGSQLTQDRPGISTENNPDRDPFFKELNDSEIQQLVEDATDEEIEELYEEDEIVLVYEDTGEEVEHHPEESQIDLMEVLSRQERLKGKIRLRKTSAKRARSTKIALKRFSSPETINKRARRLAIKLMKKRMLRGRNPAKVSVGEKERIEKTLAKRKDTIDRIAIKLVPRIRNVEKSRMSHGKVTKGSVPSVF